MNLKNFFSLKSQVWATSIANAVAAWDQLRITASAKSPEGLSFLMFVVFLWIQVVYATVGWRDKRWGMFWGMSFSAIASALTIARLIYLYLR